MYEKSFLDYDSALSFLLDNGCRHAIEMNGGTESNIQRRGTVWVIIDARTHEELDAAYGRVVEVQPRLSLSDEPSVIVSDEGVIAGQTFTPAPEDVKIVEVVDDIPAAAESDTPETFKDEGKKK